MTGIHRPSEPGEIPVLGLDFGYLEEAQDACPILCGRDNLQKWLLAIPCPNKLEATEYNLRTPAAQISRFGYAKLTMRTDGEPAIAGIKRKIMKALKEASGM